MIRRYQPGDHVAIARIFYEAVHQIARADYSEAQRRAWASAPIDVDHWKERCARKQPFVKLIDGVVVGFMELDPDGHIDCTYVDPAHAGTGVMSQVMAAVKEEARHKKLPRLYAEVSLTARRFFERHGFTILRENFVTIRGETLMNLHMECLLPHDPDLDAAVAD